MALKKTSILIPKELDGVRLDQALADLLPKASGMELSKGKIRKLIVAGAVYLNTGRVRIASKTVRAGARIEVYIDPAKLHSESEARERTPDGSRPKEWKLTERDLLFEDEWIMGVNKPAGLPTQPTLDEARANLFALLKKFRQARDGADAYVGLHHRLDRDTSGVMLFTKAKIANAGVGRLFSDHLAEKTYVAIVSVGKGAVADEWTVDDFLARDKVKAGQMKVVKSGGDRAVTHFKRLAESSRIPGQPGYALILAKPKTGRMHQIRVHLATAGMPIVGDRTYGGEMKTSGGTSIPRVMLHAGSLTFPHPITKLQITFEAPLPSDFSTCLRHLGLEIPSSVAFEKEPRS
ncbi:MAG: RluA family pseudouridine synthase [Cryobacterium sp.]|nr:RluA family pseudouridine synthase [Oligoflexia bacterium]